MKEMLLTVEEAAERLNVGRTTVYDFISKNEIKTVKIGRLRRIPSSSIDEFIFRKVEEMEMK